MCPAAGTIQNNRERIFMEQQAKKKIAQSIQDFQLPLYTEIPNVGLFLEQTTKFVSEYFATMPGITITSSMISNYVKKGLVHNPIKKQYYRDQIAHIIFIAVAKTVLPLENIQRMIRLQEKDYSDQGAYEYFCLEFHNILQYVFGVTDTLEPLGEKETDEKLLLRNTIFSVSYKLYLDKCFEYLNLPAGK